MPDHRVRIGESVRVRRPAWQRRGHTLALRVRRESEWRHDDHRIVDAPLINVAGANANFDGRYEMLCAATETTLQNIKAAAER